MFFRYFRAFLAVLAPQSLVLAGPALAPLGDLNPGVETSVMSLFGTRYLGVHEGHAYWTQRADAGWSLFAMDRETGAREEVASGVEVIRVAGSLRGRVLLESASGGWLWSDGTAAGTVAVPLGVSGLIGPFEAGTDALGVELNGSLYTLTSVSSRATCAPVRFDAPGTSPAAVGPLLEMNDKLSSTQDLVVSGGAVFFLSPLRTVPTGLAGGLQRLDPATMSVSTVGRLRSGDFMVADLTVSPRGVLFAGRGVGTSLTGLELRLVPNGAPLSEEVADLNPGTADGSPDSFVRVGDDVFFRATLPSGQRAVHRYSAAGEVAQVAVLPVANSLSSTNLGMWASEGLLFAETGDGNALYVVDPESGSVANLLDSGLAEGLSVPLIFRRMTGTQPGLWITGGTVGSTRFVASLGFGSSGAPDDKDWGWDRLPDGSGRVVFVTSSGGTRLRVMDPSEPDAPEVLGELGVVGLSSGPGYTASLGGDRYLVVANGVGGQQLVEVDPAAEPVFRPLAAPNTSGSRMHRHPVSLGPDRVALLSMNGSGGEVELWAMDVAAGVNTRLATVGGTLSSSSMLPVDGGAVYRLTMTSGEVLVATDGTQSGTVTLDFAQTASEAGATEDAIYLLGTDLYRVGKGEPTVAVHTPAPAGTASPLSGLRIAGGGIFWTRRYVSGGGLGAPSYYEVYRSTNEPGSGERVLPSGDGNSEVIYGTFAWGERLIGVYRLEGTATDELVVEAVDPDGTVLRIHGSEMTSGGVTALNVVGDGLFLIPTGVGLAALGPLVRVDLITGKVTPVGLNPAFAPTTASLLPVGSGPNFLLGASGPGLYVGNVQGARSVRLMATSFPAPVTGESATVSRDGTSALVWGYRATDGWEPWLLSGLGGALPGPEGFELH